MNWLRNSVRNKLLVLLGTALGLVVAAALYSFETARGGMNSLIDVNRIAAGQSHRVQQVETAFKQQVQEWKNLLLRGSDRQALEKHWNAFEAKDREVQDEVERLAGLVPNREARDLLSRFQTVHFELHDQYAKGLEAFKASGFNPSVGDAALRGIDSEPAQLLADAMRLIEEAARRDAEETGARTRQGLLAGLALIVLVSLSALALCAMFIVRAVTRPMQRALHAAQAVAAGDLTQRLEPRTRDEIGLLLEALERMRADLREAVGTIQDSAGNVHLGAGEIARGNADLSRRTEAQASSIEATASSMAELASTVKSNSESARQASELARGASEMSGLGRKVVREVVETMDGITDASRKIADIIGVIDGISFQTNILALNAAVEAARAGEQGRGFAVVASEVRSLAQRSASAAKEIKALIESSAGRVADGSRLVGNAGKTMEQVAAAVERVTGIVSEIAQASREQLSGIERVGGAIAEMDRVVQQNAALVEQSAAAAENLSGQAEVLVDTVALFRVDGGLPAKDAQWAQPAVPLPSDGGRPAAVPSLPRIRSNRSAEASNRAADPN